MNADLLISQLLEAVEVGDDGVYLKPDTEGSDKTDVEPFHSFKIIHPVHGNVGYINGFHYPTDNSFDIGYVSVFGHPNYEPQEDRPAHPDNYSRITDTEGAQSRDNYSGLSRTFVRSALRSLRQHIPNLETITGHNRLTGTHAIAGARTGDRANTSVRIPKSIRKSV